MLHPAARRFPALTTLALALGAVLVTDNVKEFSRVSGLAVENWLSP